jgi:hypothetical protein
MINTKALYYSKLIGNSALTTILGGTDHIANAYPEVIPKFPFLAFVDENQEDSLYADNLPNNSNVAFTLHVFTKTNAGMPTTWDIGSIAYGIFSTLYFHCGTNGEVPDPTEGVRHRVMRFSREVIS